MLFVHLPALLIIDICIKSTGSQQTSGHIYCFKISVTFGQGYTELGTIITVFKFLNSIDNKFINIFNTEINLNILLIFHSGGNKTEPTLCNTETIIVRAMLISKLAVCVCGKSFRFQM